LFGTGDFVSDDEFRLSPGDRIKDGKALSAIGAGSQNRPRFWLGMGDQKLDFHQL